MKHLSYTLYDYFSLKIATTSRDVFSTTSYLQMRLKTISI